MNQLYQIKTAGDCAISVEFKNEISEDVNNQVSALRDIIENGSMAGITGSIPTYRSLLVQYNPQLIRYGDLCKYISESVAQVSNRKNKDAKIYIIPVYYGDEYGPDLTTVAEKNNMSLDQVVEKHTSRAYRIYMLGFTPGFPYLGGMDECIATPRLQQPRTKIPAGSVGIAGKQTGIYPIDSPGGWQIIGRTPVKLFDIDQAVPLLLEAGHYIRFKSVDLKTYKDIENRVLNKTYTCETQVYKGGDA